MIRLNANELPWQPYDPMALPLAQLKLNQYPNAAYSELKNTLANQLGCSDEQLTLGNGSDELIWLIIAVLLRSGDTLVTHAPTFGEYERMAKLSGVNTVYAPLETDWRVELDSLLTIARRQGAKLAVICRPNNPTGELVAAEKLIAFLENFEGYVLLDEAYIEFADAPETLPLLNRFPNLMLLRTFSKAYGLAGLRLGYCVASPAIASALNSGRPPYNVNVVTEAIALNALGQQNNFQADWQRMAAAREDLCEGLAALQIAYMPSAANFVLLKDLFARFGKNGPALAEVLYEAGYAVRSFNEPWLSDCLRLTVGTPEQNAGLLEVLCQL